MLTVMIFKQVLKHDEVLSGYQPGQMVEWWKNQCFKTISVPVPVAGKATNLISNIKALTVGTVNLRDPNIRLSMF
jgi:hypothetical protein